MDFAARWSRTPGRSTSRRCQPSGVRRREAALIRQVYTLMVCPDVVVPRSIGLDTHERIDKLLGVLIAAQNNPSTTEDRDANLPRITTDVNGYEVWSWDRQRIWHSCRVGQIPKPGVIFVMPAGAS